MYSDLVLFRSTTHYDLLRGLYAPDIMHDSWKRSWKLGYHKQQNALMLPRHQVGSNHHHDECTFVNKLIDNNDTHRHHTGQRQRTEHSITQRYSIDHKQQTLFIIRLFAENDDVPPPKHQVISAHDQDYNQTSHTTHTPRRSK